MSRFCVNVGTGTGKRTMQVRGGLRGKGKKMFDASEEGGRYQAMANRDDQARKSACLALDHDALR